MMGHLKDEELTDDLLDRDERRLRPALDALAGWARGATDRPESFWAQQRDAVWARLAVRKKRAGRFRALAAVVSLFLFALALLLGNRHPAKAPPRAQADPDQELLLRVQQTMQSDGPQALEPAALLAAEISQEANSGSARHHSSEGGKPQ